MNSATFRAFVRRIARTPNYQPSPQEWADAWENLHGHYRARGMPQPCRFETHEQRLQVYALRWAAKLEIFNRDDVHPEDIADATDDPNYRRRSDPDETE